MKVRHLLILIAVVFFTNYAAKGQNGVSINTSGTVPDGSAILDMSAQTDKGMLVPKVALTSTILAGPIASPATGLLVWNTATAGVAPNNVTPGLYYNSGTAGAPTWVKIVAGATISNDWTQDGNSNGALRTIGTNDNYDFPIETNGIERMRVMTTGAIAIGTAVPDASVSVDITSTTKGILLPRIALTATNTAGPTTLPATGMVLWNTATAGVAPNDVTPGLYYNGGTPAAPSWVRLGPSGVLTASNGLTVTAGDVKLGGTLIQNTTVTQGNWSLTTANTGTANTIVNLSSTGDFDIQDNGVSALFVRDDAMIGIGTNAPSVSARLDISDPNRGLLIPRVALTATNAAGPVTTPATGLMVYNTATAGVSPNNVTPGHYYWNGVQWLRYAVGGVAWEMIGNSGTNAATNFIGTSDAVDLVIRTNNTEKMRVQSGGNVGIGAVAPSEKLEIGGVNSKIFMNSATSNMIVYAGTGVAAPTLTTRSAGTKIVFYPQVSATEVDYAMGINGSTLWHSVPGTLATYNHAFFGGTSELMRIQGDGRVAIGTVAPDVSAILDVNAANRGILAPRVALTAVNAAGPIATPATGLLVYNTATAGVIPNNVVPGYYYNSGSTVAPVWKRFATGNSDAWHTTGNFGTTAATNFIGTADNIDFVTRTNNTERMRTTAAGNVGINAAAPSTRLAVNGNGVNVYSTDVWVENNIHVQGNENLTVGGRGRLRVGTAWGYDGLYTEASSGSLNNDLVLGASSGTVRVGPGIGIAQNNLLISGTTTSQRQIIAQDYGAAGSQNIVIGDDTYLTDLDLANITGIYGVSNPNQAGIQFGNNPTGLLYGNNGNFGVGTVSPNTKFHVVGDMNNLPAIWGQNTNTSAGTVSWGIRGECGSTALGSAGILGMSTNSGQNEIGVAGDYALWGASLFGLAWASSYADMPATRDFGLFATANYPTCAGVYARDMNGAAGSFAIYGTGKFAVTGAKAASVPTSKGNQLLYCTESPEMWFEDLGYSELNNGTVHIELDALYMETIHVDQKHKLHVFLQEQGESNGLIVILDADGKGFTVKEKNNGTSNIGFSYRIMGKRRYYQEHRFGVDSNQPFADNTIGRKDVEPITQDPMVMKKFVEDATRAKEELYKKEQEEKKKSQVR